MALERTFGAGLLHEEVDPRTGTETVGLFQKPDGSSWVREPDGTETRLPDGGGGGGAPSGPAGGVLGGNYPNPGFAVDMATQAELDALDLSALKESDFDAKGDLLVGTGPDAFDQLPVGANGYVLTAASSETTGVKWAPPLELYVGDFGAVGDGVTDDTAAIQATLDAADAMIVNSSEIPNVVLGPHIYAISDELHVNRPTFRGQRPNSGTRLIWNGAAGGRMLVKLAGDQTSFGLIQDINFRAGSALPATFIDFTEATNALDKFLILSRLQFVNCSGDAIKVGAWVNQHWEHLRWDAIGGYAMNFTTTGGMSGDSFVLDKFTYDHSLVSGQGQGFCYIDNQAGGGALFTIKGGRIEVNNAWDAPQAMIHLRVNDVAPPARLMGLCFEDIAFVGSAGGAEVFFYRETAAATGSQSLILRNVTMSSVTTMFGGTWPATQYLPPVANYGLLVLDTNGSSSLAPYDITTSRLGILCDSTQPAIVTRRAGDTGDRFRLSGFGALEWANATGGAVDTNLYRQAANLLKTDDKLVAVLGLGVGNSLAATTLGTVVAKMEIFADSGASLGFIPIYDAIT